MSGYENGVTITVNGSPASILAAELGPDGLSIRYVLSGPVNPGDTVTFSYDPLTGSLQDRAGVPLGAITGLVVSNNVVFSGFSDDFSAEGELANPWQAVGWSAAAGQAVPAPQTTGAELVGNGDMELTTGWTALSSPATNERSTEQVHGGTYSRKLAGNNSQGIGQTCTVQNAWNEISAWLYVTAGSVYLTMGGSGVGPTVSALNQWTQTSGARPVGTNQWISLYALANNSAFYADDVSVKRLDPASLFATIAAAASPLGVSCLLPVMSNYRVAGAVMHLDDPADPGSYLLACHNGVSSIMTVLYKDAALTVLNTANARTYQPYQRLGIGWDGTNYRVYYGGSLVYTAADQGLAANAYSGLFATHSATRLAGFAAQTGTPPAVGVIGDSVASAGTPLSWAWQLLNGPTWGLCRYQNLATGGKSIMGATANDMWQQVDNLATADCDTILIEMGTNDANNAAITAQYQDFLSELAGTNPRATLYCQGILPGGNGARTAINGYIQAAVNGAVGAGVSAVYVDTDGWIDPAGETTDGVHPTAAGHTKILARWQAILAG